MPVHIPHQPLPNPPILRPNPILYLNRLFRFPRMLHCLVGISNSTIRQCRKTIGYIHEAFQPFSAVDRQQAFRHGG